VGELVEAFREFPSQCSEETSCCFPLTAVAASVAAAGVPESWEFPIVGYCLPACWQVCD